MKYQKYLDKLQIDLSGKTYIITGANAGIGFDTAAHLLYLKATIIMACRNLKKAQDSKNKLLEQFPDAKIFIEEYDQSSYRSIISFVNRIKNSYHIDGLVCNAGVYYPRQDLLTEDGFELTVGTNYLGQFMLVDALKEQLMGCRTVIVTSLTARMARMRKLDDSLKISRNKRYAFSKLLLAKESFELNHNDKLMVSLVHPGICATNILFNKDTGLSSSFARLGRRFLNLFTHPSSKAALCSVLGLVCDYRSDLYIKPRGPFAISGYPRITKIPRKYHSQGLCQETIEYLSKKVSNYATSK